MNLSDEQFAKLVRLIETSGAMQARKSKPDSRDEFESWKRLYEDAKAKAKEALVGGSNA